MKRSMIRVFVLFVACVAGLQICRADELAAVTGLVTDPNGRSVPGVTVIITNLATNVTSRSVTNDQGIYRVPSLQPGIYRMTLDKDGFKSIVKSGVELHVQDIASINFELQLGSVNETVTVSAGGLVINTTDATVSTVVDRQFAENLPLNGRSFQTLIQLTPGVVVTVNNGIDTGQFSVNGQRASSNYWTVDGVSANVGLNSNLFTGNGPGGTLGSVSIFGGTNSLVSVDALQEFRIQTSTFAPEFGRTPGAQVSIVTRSGTNEFHGALFDYLRNDALDANDWFNGATNPPLPKAKERQNDFGGTFGGPIIKNRTFFFFSYEGLRLRLPKTALTNVPDLKARQNAIPAMQPFLNAYPVPNGADNAATGVAQFNLSFSNPGTLDAYSIRVDHKATEKLTLFGRYNYSPSEFDQRGVAATSLSTMSRGKISTQTGTAGATWNISSYAVNDFRFNFSDTKPSATFSLDNFGGAVPVASALPNPFSTRDSRFGVFIFSLGSQGAELLDGRNAQSRQRQLNVVDNVSLQKGSHVAKFGVDFRRLTPQIRPYAYSQIPLFGSVSAAANGSPLLTIVQAENSVDLSLRNLGLFAQDSWRLATRLTVTYGVRWDVDFAPSSTEGPGLEAVTGFNLADLSQLALAPAGTPPFRTPYGGVAPRVGIAYQLSQNQRRATVIRGGFGVFYDLATAEVGNNANTSFYPFGATKFAAGPFPLSPSAAAPPTVVPPNAVNGQILYGFDPNLKLPYTLQWNVAVEQSLGSQQTISATYIGSSGRRLIQTAAISNPNPNYANAQLVTNAGMSSYNALQVQFQRRLSRGLQGLAGYTWAHSIDTGSASSNGNGSNALVVGTGLGNRGPSDFDVRHALSVAVTYEIPTPKANRFTRAILGGWSLQNVVQTRSAPPVDIFYSAFGALSNGFRTNVRPDIVSGQPLYLFGSSFPGGKGFNPNAFTAPPTSPAGCDPFVNFPCDPARQGNVPRNFLRGFGYAQWDFAVHRDFPIRESLKLQFRAEMFNVLNHPNFGQPVGDLQAPSALNPQFGRSIQMLGQSLGGSIGSGGTDPLYAIGGPRSIQFAMKLQF